MLVNLLDINSQKKSNVEDPKLFRIKKSLTSNSINSSITLNLFYISFELATF